MSEEEADELYLRVIETFHDNDDRDRLRNTLVAFLEDDKTWVEAVEATVMISKTWLPAKERKAAIDRMDAAEEEYNEALAASDAMVSQERSREGL